VWASPAIESRFAKHARLSADALSRSLAIEAVWLTEGGSEEDLAPALYQALQQARVWDLNTVVIHLADQQGILSRSLRLKALGATGEPRAEGLQGAQVQLLDVALHEASRRCSRESWEELRPGLAREAVDTVRRWAQTSFMRGSWTRAVLDRTLTREQYVQTLCSLHHYVRQTTQHLGRAVANAPDRELRRRIIKHLNGETNHEVWIENDLTALGEDVEYLARHRVPNTPTRTFMALQESSIDFHHDAMLFMACPLVVEGLAAHLPAEFVPCLHELARSWGIAKPEKATRFMTAHVHTDGGDDGHWESTAEMLRGYLVDEATQRRFLCTLRAAADSIQRCFDANVDEFRLFTEARSMRAQLG
jgi:hypothetical protein